VIQKKIFLQCALAVIVAWTAAPIFGSDKNLTMDQSIRRLSFRVSAGESVNYLLYAPSSSLGKGSSSLPLILFLHGSLQRGDDPSVLLGETIFAFARRAADFPFFIVAPQCRANTTWSPRLLKELLDEITRSYPVDEDRLYLTGFSMGGYGTWKTAIAYPGTFAAIAPICGFGDVARAARLKDVPIWAFHGARDANVPLSESTKMADAVRGSGGDVRLTVYPELGHECWPTVYRDSRIYLWFLMHKRVHTDG
jgi:predicted peptidase